MAPPDTAQNPFTRLSARERAIMRDMAPAMDGMFEHHGAALAAQLEVELGARAGGEEPDLPAPRPDGVLASIAGLAAGA